ncbi:MAG: hypothetical protein U5L96_21165 [Owenweeksia sp.]|nr:hypothetical protein [Owenweeksia sp.]
MPNPGNGHFELNLPVDGDYELSLLDANGRILEQQSFYNKGATHELELY